jgi:choline dehydrogenase-like flavoprotein
LIEEAHRRGFAIARAPWPEQQHSNGCHDHLHGEILFNLPSTAHCLGGCAMAGTPRRGVVDGRGRVFGYQNLLFCDGSIVGANLGVNPSLTIAALAEHVMFHIAPKTFA